MSTENHVPNASVVDLQDKQMVSGYQAPLGVDVSHDRSETVMQVENQQIVTQNIDLFGGGSQKQVPQQQQQQQQQPQQQNDSNEMFFGMTETNEVEVQEQQGDNGGGGDIFGDIEQEENPYQSRQAISQPVDDLKDDEEEEVDIFAGVENTEPKVEEKSGPTILDVWNEERREILGKRAQKERDAQQALRDEARKQLEEFHNKRRERISNSKKDALSREKDLRQDYDSVFKHGTIWQQVAKLVDLQNSDERVERMKTLLIELKNEAENQN